MSEQKNNIPNLRFPKFSGEWEEKTLGEIGHTYTGLSGKSKEDFEKGNSKFITFMNVLNNVKIKSDIMGIVNIKDGERQNKVLNGDMLFNTSSETPEEVGFCSVYDLGEKNDVYLNSFCFGYRFKNQSEHYPLFLAYFFRSSYGRKLMHKMAQGVTRYNLSKENFNKTQVYFPLSLSEQQKIADCLSAMDELIAVQAEKVEALKEKKTGLMQQLFPQPSETTPRLRFPEFKGEWEVKKLGEVASSFSGGTPKSSESKYYGGDIPFIRSGEIHGCKTELYITEEGLNKSSAKLVSKGDLLIALYGATSGEVAISKIDGAINQAILCVRSQSINSNYLCNYLEYKKDTITSKFLQGGQGNLSSDIIMSLNIPSPSPAEQEKIASCLSALDDQIAAETEKLTALKDYKKGLMQQLFPQPAK